MRILLSPGRIFSLLILKLNVTFFLWWINLLLVMWGRHLLRLCVASTVVVQDVKQDGDPRLVAMDTTIKKRQKLGQKLQNLYETKLLPLEKYCKFHELVSAKLSNSFFDTKPVFLLIGQYSTGKTTFIRNCLGADFPGMQIGREPTTDKFTIVLHDKAEGIEPGNTLINDQSRYNSLSKFGEIFLSHFQCSRLPNKLLESVTFIDTPGVLSRRDQSVKRGYDFMDVINDLGILADRIIFMFDPDKLDIADELEHTLELFKKFPRKCKFILNKVDNLNCQRIYDALLWNLGQVMKTPEVPEVFVGYEGSHINENDIIQDKPLPALVLAKFSLDNELTTISRKTELLSEKLDYVASRARKTQVLARVIDDLLKELPSPWKFWILDKNAEALKKLGSIYHRAIKEFNLNAKDLDIDDLRQNLKNYDFKRHFKRLPKDDDILEEVGQLLSKEIPNLNAEINSLAGLEQRAIRLENCVSVSVRRSNPANNTTIRKRPHNVAFRK